MTGGRGILIVEDENVVALHMRMRLEAMGYRALDVVDSGDLAIERTASMKPDLILMDIKLKDDQDGILAAEQLGEQSDVPVILVTAYADEGTLERAKRASPYGYIVKPFHERELWIAIELALYKYQYELTIRKARDVAEEANRVKGDFLANMSHELKTPLNSVIGFTEIALAMARESEQREYLALALSSAKTLLSLIDSVLDFARMEAGKLPAVSTPFSLDAVLGECVDSIATRAFAKELELNLGRDPAIPDALLGDSSLLKQVLFNLMDNAVKFTEQGRIRLGVSLRDNPPGMVGGTTIEFEVADTGIGMPGGKISVAFDRFTQLDSSMTRKAGGTGLGLTVVAKSVQLMGGRLSVTSEEGFADASLVLFRLGFAVRHSKSLKAACSPQMDLVVGTRIGGTTRRRLGNRPGIAFTALPLRSDGLSAALSELSASSSDNPGGSGAEQVSRRPSERRTTRDRRLVHEGRNESKGCIMDDRATLLRNLAEVLTAAAATGDFADVEREAKTAQGAFAGREGEST